MRDGLGRLQRVVLLGGTSDIGRAIVDRVVATRGVAEVVLAGRDRDGLERGAAELTATGVAVSVVALDARDPGEVVAAAVDECLQAPTDVVVHAIGMLPHDDRDGVAPGLAAAVFDVNTTGSGVMLLAAARRLQDQGHGTLVALSSVAAVRARPDNLVYGAAKAGYDALARGLADQVRGSGARVLVVRPGFVHSSMTATHDVAPLARQPEDVAAAVDRALDRPDRPGATVVWVPAAMAAVALGIRLLPGRALAAAARRIADDPDADHHQGGASGNDAAADLGADPGARP